MEFLDNFGKKVQDVAFIAAEKAQQVAAVASEKASIVADKAKTEYEMAAERRSMDKNYVKWVINHGIIAGSLVAVSIVGLVALMGTTIVLCRA